MASDNELLIRINGTAKDFLDEVDKVKKKSQDLEKVLTKVAKVSAAAFTATAIAIGALVKQFADFEKALIGVGKTTGIEGPKLKKFGKEFQNLAKTIPLSTNELLGIAQAAGQLGVKGEKNILKFTETVAKLGVATDLSGEQGAIALTRILNITGEAIDTIDVFGSVIVRLGNNFAATESQIVRSTSEVARSTAQFKIGTTNATALGTSLAALGQQAQLGGSVVGRSFRQIDKVIREGGQNLKNLTKLTGLTGEQLKQTFEEDATQVFQLFLEGLQEVDAKGGSITETLATLGLAGDEVNKVLPTLAVNAEIVADALRQANDEVENTGALNKEAAAAFEALASQGQLLLNDLTSLAVNIGEQLAPAVLELIGGLRKLIGSLNEMDSETLANIASLLKFLLALSGGATIASVAALAFLKIRTAMIAIRLAFIAGRISAIAFWASATLGASLLLAFLPEIIEGVSILVNKFNEKKPQETLESITGELKNINEEIDELQSKSKFALRGDEIVHLRDLEERRKELERLREAKIRASKDFGTGKFLVEPVRDDSGFDTSIPGLDQQEIPLKTPAQEEADAKELAAAKRKEDAKNALLSAAAAKRIEAAQLENDQLKEIRAARIEGATEDELAALERRLEIEAESIEAKKIKNQEERELALENLTLQHEQELASIEEFEQAKDERDAERREERAALNEELGALTEQQRASLSEKDKAAFQTDIDTKAEAQTKAAKRQLASQVKERNQFQQDEIKSGKFIAEAKAFFRKDEVVGAKVAAGELVALTQSKNSTLKGIGKAAARVQAAIKTAEGAISAYASLSGIPIIGPVLGAAAAGAIIAFGIEQQGKISAAAHGGFVPPGGAGARDKVPILAEEGELLVPSAIAPNFIQSVGNPSNGDFASDDATAPIDESGETDKVIRLEGDLIQNEEFVANVATELRDLMEFDNVEI